MARGTDFETFFAHAPRMDRRSIAGPIYARATPTYRVATRGGIAGPVGAGSWQAN
jgi:hypothetical protein